MRTAASQSPRQASSIIAGRGYGDHWSAGSFGHMGKELSPVRAGRVCTVGRGAVTGPGAARGGPSVPGRGGRADVALHAVVADLQPLRTGPDATAPGLSASGIAC